jgi:4-amino-4-deoxy-L-arabinose transferase-like glycosyltransferase
MKTVHWYKVAFFLVFSGLLVNYFMGIREVPIHPDESTQIFTSNDVTEWFTNPFSLAFENFVSVDTRMRYRLIDSPFTRTLIGLGLMIGREIPTQVDWNWSGNWEANERAGAVPSPRVLLIARLSISIQFPISCLFIFLAGRKTGGNFTGILTVLLFASNALILLHTRRAMAEGALVCFICATIWFLMQADIKPWITAIFVGLAINTKQIATPLVPLWISLMVTKPGMENPWKKRIISSVIFFLILLAISTCFNPVFWKSPIKAMQAGWYYREELSTRMTQTYRSSYTPVESVAIIIRQTFIEPPAIMDVGNYRMELQDQISEYFRNPMNSAFRGMLWGLIFLALTLLGWGIMVSGILRKNNPQNKPYFIVLSMSLVFLLTLYFYTPAFFQRYFVILIPLFSISQAVGLEFLQNLISVRLKSRLL